MFTSSTADAVPLPLEGKDKTRGKVGETSNVERDTPHIAASEALPPGSTAGELLDMGSLAQFTSAFLPSP